MFRHESHIVEFKPKIVELYYIPSWRRYVPFGVSIRDNSSCITLIPLYALDDVQPIMTKKIPINTLFDTIAPSRRLPMFNETNNTLQTLKTRTYDNALLALAFIFHNYS